MLYAILGTDNPNSSAARLHARPRHLERVPPLVQQGRLVGPGPLPALDAAQAGPAWADASGGRPDVPPLPPVLP